MFAANPDLARQLARDQGVCVRVPLCSPTQRELCEFRVTDVAPKDWGAYFLVFITLPFLVASRNMAQGTGRMRFSRNEVLDKEHESFFSWCVST